MKLQLISSSMGKFSGYFLNWFRFLSHLRNHSGKIRKQLEQTLWIMNHPKFFCCSFYFCFILSGLKCKASITKIMSCFIGKR